MDNAKLGKFANFKEFLASLRDLSAIFEKADRKALQSALKEGDFKGVCTALHVSETRLASMLRQGSEGASRIVRESPDLAVDALKQHTANGSRP